MGFRLAVSGGAENISLDERTIEKVSFGSDSAADSNARATDFGIAGQVVREYTIPNAFVMEYKEHLDDETGVGTFYLHIKQKKDENDAVKIEGGYGE